MPTLARAISPWIAPSIVPNGQSIYNNKFVKTNYGTPFQFTKAVVLKKHLTQRLI
jgi:hypothetical protein